MEGDFTRNSDDPDARYSGVLMQQGRVQLDADWNEHWMIQLRALRSALRDLIGPHGGPFGEGFKIGRGEPGDRTLTIGTGVYYVDGIRCEQRRGDATLTLPERGSYLVVLEVWERHVNAIEDPHLREVALLGPDTATRAQVMCRVRLLAFDGQLPNRDAPGAAEELVEGLLKRPRLRLAAQAETANANTDPCELSPRAGYRGRENQLYRVQIHDADFSDNDDLEAVLFTFKWSRDNGSVVFPILPIVIPKTPATSGDNKIVVTVKVGHLGRDERYGLTANDIVEFMHDHVTDETLDDLEVDPNGIDPGRPGLLGRVLAPIDPDDLTVPIEVYAPDSFQGAEITQHPYLRRWDQRDTTDRKLRLGAIPVKRADVNQRRPLRLEDGVEIMFASEAQRAQPLARRAGDYWQIPTRTVTGNVLWPTDESGSPVVRTARLVPPHGPERHYAPLAFASWNGTAVTALGVRRLFAPLAKPEP